MMKQIIVPLDFSDESINGLEMAIMISSKTKANIQMVYVIKKAAEFAQISNDEEQRNAKLSFQQLVNKYEHKLAAGVEFTYIIKKGKIYEEVVDQAESFEGSVIVAATHGASGFEEAFIGSNALKIITASEHPVIAIRHGVVPKNFRKILLPIDFTRDTRQKVPFTLKLARYFGSQVHVMGVSTGSDQELMQRIKSWSKQVTDYFTENNVEAKNTYHRGDSVTGLIIDYAVENNIDLISIMTEQDSPLSGFVIGSNAQQLISKAPVPILCNTPKDLNIRGRFKTYKGVPPA